jgi:hypothetical protein
MYYGGVMGRYRQGVGKHVKSDYTFEGFFVKNQRDSIGYTFYSDGRVYQGTYKNNEEHGAGEWMQNGPK